MSKFRILGIIIWSVSIFVYACSERRDPVTVPTHPDGWNDEQSVNFHGKMVLESPVNAQNCGSCHGVDFKGGTSGVNCTTSGCHEIYPHAIGFKDASSPNSHARFIANMLAWDITSCQDCHGSDYGGDGSAKKNCQTCHALEDGPEACNVCHGSEGNAAPPADLSGNVVTTAVGVGAHQVHLNGTTYTNAMQQDCSHCHVVPETYSDAGHIDNPPLPAEITFGALATNSGKQVPTWDSATATCSNVYCHGSFEFKKEDGIFSWGYKDPTITGNDPDLNWISVGSGQAECGTCHDLPPKGHVGTAEATCNICHGRVVDVDQNIIDKDLHINGKIEVF